MKRNKALVLMATAAILFAGCAKDEIGQVGGSDAAADTTYVPLPTNDIMEVTSSLKTFVYDDNLSSSKFGSLLANRMTTRATSLSEDGVATVIMEGKKAASLSTDEREDLVNLLCGNANIVVVDPTLGEWNSFLKNFCTTFDTMEDEMRQPEEVPTEVRTMFRKVRDMNLGEGEAYLLDSVGVGNNDLMADAIALRGNETYVVADLSKSLDVENKSKLLYKDSILVDVDVKDVTDDGSNGEEDLNDYQYGQAADAFTEWINEQPNTEETKAELRSRGMQMQKTLARSDSNSDSYDISSLMDAQVFTYQFIVYNESKVYSYAQLSGQETVKVKYEIWPLHDASNKTDYYSIHESILVRNSEFNTELTKNPRVSRDKGLKSVWLYGPYMTDVISEHKLEDATGELIFFSPQNSVGSTTHSQSFDFSVGGGISSEGPELSGSFTFSDGWSRDIPDLTTTIVTQNEEPKWTYHASTVLEGSYWLDIGHTKPASIQISDCQIDNTWVWQVPNSNYGNTYTMRTVVDVISTILRYETVRFACYAWDYYDTSWIIGGVPVKHITLDAPLRAQQEWNISLSSTQAGVDEGSLETYMKRHYSKFAMPLQLGAPSDTDTSVIDAYISDLGRKMKADVAQWKKAGYSGTVTVSFKRSGEIATYKDLTLDLD